MSEEQKQNQEKKLLPESLEECHRLLGAYLDGWKRAKADYLNLKKGETERFESFRFFLVKNLTEPILDIADGLEDAFRNLPPDLTDNEWVSGIKAIKKQIEDYLFRENIKPIETKGDFNPELHEAVEMVAAPEGGEPRPDGGEGGKSGEIAGELQKGYLLRDKVLRPAKVKVYK